MQSNPLKGFATEDGRADARRYAVLDFRRWSGDVMKGKVKL